MSFPVLYGIPSISSRSAPVRTGVRALIFGISIAISSGAFAWSLFNIVLSRSCPIINPVPGIISINACTILVGYSLIEEVSMLIILYNTLNIKRDIFAEVLDNITYLHHHIRVVGVPH